MLIERSSSPASLLRGVRTLLPEIQADAARLDSTAQFPLAAFEALKGRGLLAATLPERLDGLGFGESESGAEPLLQLLYLLGEANLSVARIFEAHVNALQLILRYGTTLQCETAARDVHEGNLFALWVTDPSVGGLRLADDAVLQGGKAFCSAAGMATRALVTAETAAGAQMLIVSLTSKARVEPSQIRLGGMRAAVTGAVDLSGICVNREAVLGRPGDYLREPIFSAGAWRSAAAALGGLAALIQIHRNELRKRGRDNEPHQRARFGQVVIAHETAWLWMEQAALRACTEDDTEKAIVAYVNLARLVVEQACLEAMRHIQRSLGLAAFVVGHPAERLCRDLATYLRQPAPDEALDIAAEHYMRAPLPGQP